MEAYTPEHKEDVTTSLNGLRGFISDAYTVVPQFKGKYKIPEVTFSYFNPNEERYYTILAEAVFVEVTEGKELPFVNIDSAASFKKNVVANGNNFRFIALETKLNPIIKNDFLHSTEFYLLLLLFFPSVMNNFKLFIANFFILLALRRLFSLQSSKSQKEKIFD